MTWRGSNPCWDCTTMGAGCGTLRPGELAGPAPIIEPAPIEQAEPAPICHEDDPCWDCTTNAAARSRRNSTMSTGRPDRFQAM
jgi:hypothetical protein